MGALFLGAIVLERLMLTPLYSDATERKDEYGLIVTFGLAYFLRNSAVIAFGPFPLKPPSFIPGVQRMGNLILTNDRLVAAGVGIALIVALLYFMKRTIWGQALDAVSQSRAAAGALVAPIFSLAPDMGVLPNIHAYVIVILGGMGSVSGSIIAGILLGESENLFTAFFPDPTRAFAYTNAFGVLVLMVVLIFRPQGLFGRRHLRME
jgi:branched-chain amino acid transport system permease protein